MDQFVGEIRLVGFTFAPPGWLFCQGQLLAISDNEALFALLGTLYGGDGQTTFGIPDLRSRSPISTGSAPGGSTYNLGQTGGFENVTLSANQLPSHVHSISAQSGNASSNSPSGTVFGSGFEYLPAPASQVTGNLLLAFGGSQSHSNLMPYIALNYMIATEGIYPSQG